MENKKLPPTYHIGITEGILKNALQNRLNENGINLTVRQLAILRFLNDQSGGVSMQIISDQTYKVNSTTTRMIDNLEKQGLVKRLKSQKDKREKLITICNSGKDIYNKAKKLAKEHVEWAMRGVSKEHEDILIHVLNKIRSNVN